MSPLCQAIDILNNTSGTKTAFQIATALAFGTGIAVLVYTIAPVSGGHINPAVTLSLYLLGEIDVVSAGAYIITQFIAAMVGAGLVWGSMYDETLRNAQDDGKYCTNPSTAY